MADLCAGSGFEGTMARYRAHIEMVEEGVFHGIIGQRKMPEADR
jgi:hypothetical protein